MVSGLAGDFEAVVSGLASDQESYPEQKIALSGTKQQLVVRLVHYFNSNADSDIISILGNRSRLRKLSPASLSSQCSSFMCSKGYSKVALIAAYRKHIYNDRLNAWKAVGKTRINIDQEIPGYGSIVSFIFQNSTLTQWKLLLALWIITTCLLDCT